MSSEFDTTPPMHEVRVCSYATTQPARAIELIDLTVNSVIDGMSTNDLKIVAKYLKMRGQQVDQFPVPF